VAAGFSVDLQDVPSGGLVPEPSTAVASIAITTTPSAPGGEAVIEVWLGRELVYRAGVSGEESRGSDDGRALTAAAVRAVAVMQAALLAREGRPAAPATATTAAVPAPTIAAAARAPAAAPALRLAGADVGVDLGVSML